ncbi:hypothetical protein C8R43DRAFT_956369 [Mycena crocata]|nr:hypothetical protein C8R43DRAFT_956369 [Mycena crocata]
MSPTTMLAAVYEPGNDNLVPEKAYPIRELEDDEVLLKVAAAGGNVPHGRNTPQRGGSRSEARGCSPTAHVEDYCRYFINPPNGAFNYVQTPAASSQCRPCSSNLLEHFQHLDTPNDTAINCRMRVQRNCRTSNCIFPFREPWTMLTNEGPKVDCNKVELGKLYSVLIFDGCMHGVTGPVGTTPPVIGIGKDGAYAQYMITPAATLVLVPDDVPVEVAAIVSNAGVTAYHVVQNAANVKPGDKVLILGVGGLGHLAVQYCIISFNSTVTHHTPLGRWRMMVVCPASRGAWSNTNFVMQDPKSRFFSSATQKNAKFPIPWSKFARLSHKIRPLVGWSNW